MFEKLENEKNLNIKSLCEEKENMFTENLKLKSDLFKKKKKLSEKKITLLNFIVESGELVSKFKEENNILTNKINELYK
jgi:hypothetical protein